MALEKAAETAGNLLAIVFTVFMLLWFASCVGCFGAVAFCPPPSESRIGREAVPKMNVPDQEQLRRDRELVERAARRREKEEWEAYQRRLRQQREERRTPERSRGRTWELNFNVCASNMRRQGIGTEAFIRDECEALATAARGESLATMVEDIERCVASGRSESSCLTSHPIFRRLPPR